MKDAKIFILLWAAVSAEWVFHFAVNHIYVTVQTPQLYLIRVKSKRLKA